MKNVLTRAASWLVEPPAPPEPAAPAEAEPRYGGASAHSRLWLPPAAAAPPRRPPSAAPREDLDRDLGAAHDVLPALDAADDAQLSPGDAAAGSPAARPLDGSRLVVIGEAEDVPALAASLALTMRRRLRRSTALILVWPGAAADPDGRADRPALVAGDDRSSRPDESAASAWSIDRALPYAPAAAPVLPGARLLAARLARRGLRARATGRLVWVSLAAEVPPPVEEATGAGRRTPPTPASPRHRHASVPGRVGAAIESTAHRDEGPGVLAHRVEAAASEAPSVLAVMAPRCAEVDALLGDRDLVVIAAEPDSPLAHIAIAELEAMGITAHAIAPPPPGLARAAALAGLRAHRLDDDAPEPTEAAIA